MTENKPLSHPVNDLRRQAEEKAREIAAQKGENLNTLSSEEIRLLLHDLRIHQIELEMQNEELHQTHEKLDALRAKYFDLYDLAPVGYVNLSETGLILEANLAAATLLGVAIGAMVSQPFNHLILPEDQDIYYLHFKQWSLLPAIETGAPRVCELRLMKKNGTPFWARLEVIVVHDAVFKYRVVIIDIMEHKQAAAELERKVIERTAALRENEERFHILANNISQLAWMADAQGSIFWYNQRWFDYTGTTIEEMSGWGWRKVHHPDHVQGVVDKIKLCFETGESWEDTFPLRGKDGLYRWFLSRAAPIRDEHGTLLRWFGTNTDVTELIQAEEEIKKAKTEAETANRAKSIFVANMSHEIRTPLNAILGFAQVLGLDPLLTPRQIEHVQTISRSGEHLLRLINDILEMSKIEAGRTPRNEAAFCLHDLLDDLEMMFRSRADAKGLQLLMERSESMPRYVSGDAGKLQQILSNLMENAVKFTKTGGVAVRVRTEAVEGKTGGDKKAMRLVAEVEDSGPGIPDADMDRIFSTFQQGEAGVNAGGTGLGLAISRRFVEMMGGALTVTSQVGKGSCFRFDVLLMPAQDIAEPKKPASRRVVGLEPGMGPYRILVVDDASINRTLLRELLQPVGFEVAEAGNGVEALEVFERWSPHAVLMDMRMPVMDGYEATRRIKATEAGRAIPVIAITASAFADSQKKVMDAGMDTYLRKPFRREELYEVLGKSLGLRYVFADEPDKIPGHPKPTALKPESLAGLPKELIRAMHQAVSEGDMIHLTELITQVEKIDSQVARGLRALAVRYEYDKLNQWLEKGETDNG